MIILGIDPGLATTGYGVIEKSKGKLILRASGVISTPAKTILALRLQTISSDLKKIISKNKPDAMSVEKLFFCRNAKTAIDVGQCRGVILLEAMNGGLPVYEFTPLQVKQAITGYGAANKKQMQEMVKTILGLPEILRPDDASDAVALAITLANSLILK